MNGVNKSKLTTEQLAEQAVSWMDTHTHTLPTRIIIALVLLIAERKIIKASKCDGRMVLEISRSSFEWKAFFKRKQRARVITVIDPQSDARLQFALPPGEPFKS